MILNITYHGSNTSDLGYLLHKNPYRPQVFELSFGNAYVFYPLVTYEKTTATLLLDINPIDLSRGNYNYDYVNDRSYVSSSFLSSALTRVYSTAISGKCLKREALVKEKLDLEINLINLPIRSNIEAVNRIFEPLGYEVTIDRIDLDKNFSNFGLSRYIDLTLKANIRLSKLLNHLYVLIPVFDNNKHYYFNKQEIEKLLSHGEGWLKTHPEKEYIIKRYFTKKLSFATEVLEKLSLESIELDEDNVNEEVVEEIEEIEEIKTMKLNDYRTNKIIEIITSNNCSSVIDFGCGEGKLLGKLLKIPSIKKITGVDVSLQALEKATFKIKNKYEDPRLELIHSSIMYTNEALKGNDCLCLIEVIEHLDHLYYLEKNIFEFLETPIIIITTPNIEYNVKYKDVVKYRHSDHRFEWTRSEFKNWCQKITSKYNYTVEYFDIGEYDEIVGSPTQMGVFKLCK